MCEKKLRKVHDPYATIHQTPTTRPMNFQFSNVAQAQPVMPITFTPEEPPKVVAAPVAHGQTQTENRRPGPEMLMADHLFVLGKGMLQDCREMVHTDYPDMKMYQEEFEMRWKRGIELIEMAQKVVLSK